MEIYKVMVVDDEKYVRRSIINRIDWASLGLEVAAEADNGRTAYDLIDTADIILVDIVMPVMNGIELVQLVRQNFKNKHFIMLSGHDDFAYTKQAIKLKIENYIKKPIDEHELRETLTQLVETLNEQNRQEQELQTLSHQAREAETMHYEMFLNSLLQGQADAPVDVPVCFAHGRFGVVLAHVNQNGENLGGCLHSLWERRGLFGGRFDDWDVFLLQNPYYKNEFRILINADRMDAADLEHAAGMLRAAAQPFARNIVVSCSTVSHDIGGIGSLYAEALKRLKHLVLGLDIRRIKASADSSSEADKACFERIDRLLSEMKQHMEKGDPPAVKRMIDKLFDTNNTHWFTIDILEMVIDELRNTMRRIALQMNLTPQLIETQAFYQPHYLLQFAGIPELHRDIATSVDAFLSRFSDQETSLMDIIIRHIHNHYEDDLMLSTISDRFYLNPSYLSQLFKAKTGINISRFIEDVRMEKARELLAHVRISVTDVAMHVGYNDANYFSKVFKKRFGILPSVYHDHYYSVGKRKGDPLC